MEEEKKNIIPSNDKKTSIREIEIISKESALALLVCDLKDIKSY